MSDTPTPPTPSLDPVRRQRIPNKLGVLWEAHPHLLLSHVLDETNPLQLRLDDEQWSAALDGALTEAGVKVSGGWKS